MKLKIKKRIEKVIATMSFMVMTATSSVFAVTDGSKPVKDIVLWIFGYAQVGGLAVVGYGMLQLAWAFKHDDADQKTRGIKTLISGLMVASIKEALKIIHF